MNSMPPRVVNIRNYPIWHIDAAQKQIKRGWCRMLPTSRDDFINHEIKKL